MGRIESPKPVTMHRFFGDEAPDVLCSHSGLTFQLWITPG